MRKSPSADGLLLMCLLGPHHAEHSEDGSEGHDGELT